MKNVTRLIIIECNMRKVDFMGYKFNKTTASYHHLIVPRRLNGETSINNGAVLNIKTSHPYLHIIEKYDPEIFYRVSSEMIDQNIRRVIDSMNLKRIDSLLRYFEREYHSRRNNKGKLLIKEEYTRRK